MKKIYLHKQWWFWLMVSVSLIGCCILGAFSDALSESKVTIWVGILGVISTTFLGFIAVWQNIRQQNDNVEHQALMERIERNNHIANFSPIVMLDSITFGFPAGNQTNYDEHYEQLLKMENAPDDSYWSPAVTITCNMKRLNENIPAYVMVNNIEIYTDPQRITDTNLYCAKNFREGFSIVAIKDNNFAFSATILTSRERSEQLKKQIDVIAKKIFFKIFFTVLSPSRVAVNFQCRGTLVTGDWDAQSQLYNNYCMDEENKPLTFIGNTEILDKEVNILGSIIPSN